MAKKKNIKRVPKRGSKISHEQFFSVLRANAGLYARTAAAIEKQFGIKYTRVAVKLRAENHPEELKDIQEQNLDIAEEGLHSLMRSGNLNVKLGAIKLFLYTQGKRRGYVERQEAQFLGKDGEPADPVTIIQLPDNGRNNTTSAGISDKIPE